MRPVSDSASTEVLCGTVKLFIFNSSTLLLLLTEMNNFVFVHQCNWQQYIITGLIESQQEAKSSCLSSALGLL